MMFQRNALAGAAWLVLASAPAMAVSQGMVDTFEDGTLMGWSSGDANPNPPMNVDTGGPGGANDNFMLLSASGFSGPGGKLVAFAGPQWSSGSDYIAAGITALGMDVDNLGSTEIDLRLFIVGTSGASVVSKDAIVVAPGGGWQHLSFSLAPSAFTTSPNDVLSSVAQIRLFHGTSPAFPGQNIAAQLGVDNVSAVPEPTVWMSLAAGLALLRARRRTA
jgi:hypothetical protein